MFIQTLLESGQLEKYNANGGGTKHPFKVAANYPWDDLLVSIDNVKLPPANAPTWRDWNYNISGGVTYPTLGFALNDYVYFTIQTSHQMVLNSVLDQHIHYSVPTDGTGDSFKFQLDVICAGIGSAWAKPTESPWTKEVLMGSDYTGIHNLEDIADIDGCNTTVSTLYKCKLTRVAVTGLEYAGEVYIDFADCHYQKDTIGSRQEGAK